MKIFSMIVVLNFIIACSSSYTLNYNNMDVDIFLTHDSLFQNNFNGLLIQDMNDGKTLVDINSERLFTPASNTKMYTLYVSALLLPEKIPSLHFRETKDSLIIWGTGDPTLLHPRIKNDSVIKFLSQSQSIIYLSDANWRQTPYGNGWAWNDFNDDYQQELSALPIYYNSFVLQVDSNKHIHSIPTIQHLLISDSAFQNDDYLFYREQYSNKIRYNPETIMMDSIVIPMHISSTKTVAEFLADTINNAIKLSRRKKENVQTISTLNRDSLFKWMMQSSDNFFAEQLLLMASEQVFDTMNTEKIIRYALDSLLRFLPQKPRWVDGSGLSRYNLFSPKDNVYLLKKLFDLFGEKRLFDILSTAGVNGTLKNRFKPENGNNPYLFAKTGTLGNNHCVSGFIKTKSRKLLVFSFMMNHFTNNLSRMRSEMDKVLHDFYNYY